MKANSRKALVFALSAAALLGAVALLLPDTSKSARGTGDTATTTDMFHFGCPEGACDPNAWAMDQATLPESYLDRRASRASANTSRWEALTYRWAIQRFPDAQSCLVDGAKSELGYDLTMVNWGAITSNARAEVCLARIHNVIGNADKSLVWFQRVGFKGRVRRYEGDHARAGTFAIFTNWDKSNGTSKSPFGWRETWLRKTLSYGAAGVVIDFSPENSVTQVSLSYPIL